VISLPAGPIWLIDATTYSRPLEPRLHHAKDRFLRIERYARSSRIGPLSPRGTGTYSAGLLRIATILAANGCAVRYLPLAEAMAAFEDPGDVELPAAIGFGAVCPTVPACAAAAELAKRRVPDLRTVLGGPHALVAARWTAARYRAAFDVISQRFDLEAAAELIGVSALALQQSGEYLDYDLLPRPLPEYGLNLMTASGCPFACSYCHDRLVPRMRASLDGGLGRIIERWPLPEHTPVHICDSVLCGGIARALKVCR
jgi:hypothetical protein